MSREDQKILSQALDEACALLVLEGVYGTVLSARYSIIRKVKKKRPAGYKQARNGRKNQTNQI